MYTVEDDNIHDGQKKFKTNGGTILRHDLLNIEDSIVPKVDWSIEANPLMDKRLALADALEKQIKTLRARRIQMFSAACFLDDGHERDAPRPGQSTQVRSTLPREAHLEWQARTQVHWPGSFTGKTWRRFSNATVKN